MEELYQFLNHYSFFQTRNGYKIIEIQDYGRKSKFLVTFERECYTVIVEPKRIQNYIHRFKFMNDKYKELIDFKYLSDDQKVLVLGYYGGLGGYNLSYYARNHISLNFGLLSNRLWNLLEDLHSRKADYIDFDKKGSNWYEYVLTLFQDTLKKYVNCKAISEKEKEFFWNFIQKQKAYFSSVKTSWIHGDLTIVNICYHLEHDDLYLIDFDDFMIGDPFYDISRIMNFANDSDILKIFKKQFCPDIDLNPIHLIYTLRVTLNWYCFIIDRNLDYQLPKQEIYDIYNKMILIGGTSNE